MCTYFASIASNWRPELSRDAYCMHETGTLSGIVREVGSSLGGDERDGDKAPRYTVHIRV